MNQDCIPTYAPVSSQREVRSDRRCERVWSEDEREVVARNPLEASAWELVGKVLHAAVGGMVLLGAQ